MIEAFAPAKVNLWLHVGARRSDGYHDLNSLMAFADFGDALSVSPAGDWALSVEGASGLDGADNLALRAGRALAEAAGLTRAAHLRRIPVAAGLGGGSADAAAALRALNKLWGLDWPLARLAALGLTLGADVPACVHSVPLRADGAGETITPLDAVPDLPAVIINPGKAAPTGAVFNAYSESANPAPRVMGAPPGTSAAELIVWLGQGGNDLEPAARRLVPEISGALEALARLPEARLTRMSGSGASCFALFESLAAANRGEAAMRAAHPDWFVQAVTLKGV